MIFKGLLNAFRKPFKLKYLQQRKLNAQGQDLGLFKGPLKSFLNCLGPQHEWFVFFNMRRAWTCAPLKHL